MSTSSAVNTGYTERPIGQVKILTFSFGKQS